MEFSWTRDQTCVPCFDRQILNHWTTRKAPNSLYRRNIDLVFLFKNIFHLYVNFSVLKKLADSELVKSTLMSSIGCITVRFSSVAQPCLTLCDPMDYSMPGFPVHHQFPEVAQTHIHQVSDAIQPSHPLSSPSPPAFNLS